MEVSASKVGAVQGRKFGEERRARRETGWHHGGKGGLVAGLNSDDVIDFSYQSDRFNRERLEMVNSLGVVPSVSCWALLNLSDVELPNTLPLELESDCVKGSAVCKRAKNVAHTTGTQNPIIRDELRDRVVSRENREESRGRPLRSGAELLPLERTERNPEVDHCGPEPSYFHVGGVPAIFLYFVTL
ncbi:hypothetical protein Bbelb_296780 [Branchiostoma belcheri]|nr:hypothetical protein Bbelb_296780 [Branchiostoma belcheri]